MEKKSNEAKMDYIELTGKDLTKTKAFYEQVFGWKFTDYGPDYTSFEDQLEKSLELNFGWGI